MKTKVLVLLCLIAQMSCKRTVLVDKGNIPTIAIENFEQDISNKLSDICVPVDIISLETSEKSIIQHIDKIIITEEEVFILDTYGAKSILVFSKKGEFKYKIGKAGRGPGEYETPLDFDISNDEIQVLSYNKVVVYNLNGEYRRQYYLNFLAQNISNISHNVNAFYGSSFDDRIVVTNEWGKKEFSYYRYSQRNRIATPWHIEKLDSITLFNIPICDTIYKVSNSSVSPYCYIDFGEYSFQNEDYSSLPKNLQMNVVDYILSEKQYAIKYYYSETDSFIILSFGYNGNHICKILSKDLHASISYSVLKCDDDIWHSNSFLLPSCTLDDNKVVFIQEYPSKVISGYDFLKKKSESEKLSSIERQAYESLNEIHSSIDDLSNPILFIAKLTHENLERYD